MLSWQDFYICNKDSGKPINEIVSTYNLYVFQNQTEWEMEQARRRLGENFYLLQENSYPLLQEGTNQHAFILDLGPNVK